MFSPELKACLIHESVMIFTLVTLIPVFEEMGL